MRKQHRMLATVGVIAAGAWIVGAVGVRLARFKPAPPWTPPTPATPLVLEARDGSTIAATFWPGRDEHAPGVLLVPGIAATHARLAPNAEWFSEQGYAVLAIDLRGHGTSSPAPHSFGWWESLDVHAAHAWLKAHQNGAKTAVVGISMGGAAALIGPDGPVPADALVLQAVFATLREAVRVRIASFLGWPLAWVLEPLLSFQSKLRFGLWPSKLEPLAAMAAVRCPVLVIGGGRDQFIPLAETETFHTAAPDPRGLWIAPGLDHDEVSDTLGKDYRARVLGFLRETVG